MDGLMDGFARLDLPILLSAVSSLTVEGGKERFSDTGPDDHSQMMTIMTMMTE